VTVSATISAEPSATCTIDFGDGSDPQTVPHDGVTCSATHRYTRQGTYTPLVEVSSFIVNMPVLANAPAVTILPSPPEITDLRVRWDAVARKTVLDIDFTDIDVERHYIGINWGDGESWPATVNSGVRTYQASHVYATTPDSALIQVLVGDRDELSDTANLRVGKPTVISNATPLTQLRVGQPLEIAVQGRGTPLPSLRVDGALPNGITFTDHGDGTGVLSGTPTPGASGAYALTFVALNGLGSAQTSFNLQVSEVPAITSDDHATFFTQQHNFFRLTTRGQPVATLSVSGALPPGVIFFNYGDGTADLGGLPAVGSEGVYPLIFNVLDSANGAVLVSQPFQLTVQTGTPLPPWTNIRNFPPQPAGDTVTFEFEGGSELGVPITGFECQLDGSGFTPCTSPHTLTNLSEGYRTFQVRAVDQNGSVTPTPAERYFEVQRPPRANPQQSPPANAAGWNREDVLIRWNWFDANPISLDCPETSTSSGEGELTVTATCSDVLGNSSTASYTVRVDKTPPTATPGQSPPAGPSGWTKEAVVVTWNWADSGSGLDPAACAATTTPNGVGTLLVEGTCYDLAGNMGAASYTVRIDQGEPLTTLTGQPESSTTSSEATFTFEAQDILGSGVAGFECSLDNAAFVACTSPQKYTGLSNGSHTFAVRAVDNVGNSDASPATFTWTINALPPGTLVGNCGGYTVYRDAQGKYKAADWSGTIQVGTNSNNTLNGTKDADLILGLGGNDKLNGQGGADLLCGGEGVDLLQGFAGNDLLDGGNGNDVLNGGAGDHDTLLAGDGNDVLLDGDGVISALGGPGNDGFTLALHNGWRDTNRESKFAGRLAAGYGNDTVVLVILDRSPFFVDVTGDERDDPPSPLEGNNDGLGLLGNLNPAPVQLKFEKQLVISAEAEAMISEDAGAEYLTEPVGNDTAPAQNQHLFLSLISR
jgi:hypothetical protein